MNSINAQGVQNQKQLHGLDHLRALAIILVFFFHYQISYFGHPDWVPVVSKFGWTGVDLFFVLSGFLIASQLVDQAKNNRPISWKTYALKRLVRIVPAYLIVLAIYFLFPLFREREALPPLWKFLTFTQNLGLNLRDAGTFSHAWSLCVEAHFYLLIPLFVSLIITTKNSRSAYWLVGILFVAGMLLRSYSWNLFYLPQIETPNDYVAWYKYVYYPTYNRLDGLLAGVLLATVSRFSSGVWGKFSDYGNQLILCGLFILLGAYFLCEDERSHYASVLGFPVIALGYGLLTAGAISSSSFLFTWNSRATAFIARISYAVYLSHKGVIHITQLAISKIGVDINSNFSLICCICSCIVAATLLNIFIEQPCINWLKKQAVRKREHQLV